MQVFLELLGRSLIRHPRYNGEFAVVPMSSASARLEGCTAEIDPFAAILMRQQGRRPSRGPLHGLLRVTVRD
ncbi:hypothetical protein AOQ73_04135 [Bradyrhizobium pachyrhizi]|nr:hypothetical protein AOQ73_04135 [Bradyrhizobium pachyrhizi]